MSCLGLLGLIILGIISLIFLVYFISLVVTCIYGLIILGGISEFVKELANSKVGRTSTDKFN